MAETDTIIDHDALQREINIEIGVLSRLIRGHLDNAIGRMGITRAQWMLTSFVARFPGSTQRAIAEALEMSEAAAGRLVDRLCSEGLLERRARDSDRRAYCVYLADTAKNLMTRISVAASSAEEEIFKGLSDDRLEQLHDMLTHVHRNISRCKN